MVYHNVKKRQLKSYYACRELTCTAKLVASYICYACKDLILINRNFCISCQGTLIQGSQTPLFSLTSYLSFQQPVDIAICMYWYGFCTYLEAIASNIFKYNNRDTHTFTHTGSNLQQQQHLRSHSSILYYRSGDIWITLQKTFCQLSCGFAPQLNQQN